MDGGEGEGEIVGGEETYDTSSRSVELQENKNISLSCMYLQALRGVIACNPQDIKRFLNLEH